MALLEESGVGLPKTEISVFHRLKRRVFLFRSPWRDYIQFILLIAAIAWLMSISTRQLGYYWQWYLVPRYLFTTEEGRLVAGPLIEGLLFTIKISSVSLVLSLAIGLGTALVRLSGSFTGRVLARMYLEVIRNTPLLVQLYISYFVLGPIIGLGRFGSGVMALTLFSASYMSEIFRAGIVSISRGQWEAAHSLGLSTFDTFRDVILPQAIRRILPPLTSQVVTLIKSSALVSAVSLMDLTLNARIVASRTFMVFEIWFTVAAIYLVITVPLSTIVNYMEKRFSILT